MQSNIVICIIILSSIAFVILAWIFFSRRRAEFKHALLVTHNSNQRQTPPQLQTRDLITESRPSVPAQSSSNSSDDTVVELKRARAKAKAKKAKVHGQIDKTRKMTGGIGHVEEPPVTVRNENKTSEPTSKAQPETGGSGKGTTPPAAAASAAAPVDPVDGDWGDTVNTTQKGSHGGWGEENLNTDATSTW